MEERRKVKNTENEYRKMNNTLKRRPENRKNKRGIEIDKCIEMEALQNKHDSLNEHRKVKEITRKKPVSYTHLDIAFKNS